MHVCMCVCSCLCICVCSCVCVFVCACLLCEWVYPVCVQVHPLYCNIFSCVLVSSAEYQVLLFSNKQLLGGSNRSSYPMEPPECCHNLPKLQILQIIFAQNITHWKLAHDGIAVVHPLESTQQTVLIRNSVIPVYIFVCSVEVMRHIWVWQVRG